MPVIRLGRLKMILVSVIYLLGTVYVLGDVDTEKKDPPRLADDPNLDVSQSTAHVATTGTLNLEEDNPDLLPNAHNLTHELMPLIERRAEEIKHKHPRDKDVDERKRKSDAKHENTINLCQRDYSKPCPLGFKHIVTKDGENTCIPPAGYTGPCMGNNLVYRNMPEEDKIAWATRCLANWPCVMCRRRYSDYCPEKWTLDKHDTTGKLMCIPSDEYQGPCTGQTISFLNYNIAMQKQWSQRCHAWWPCDEPDLSNMPDTTLPISMAATLYRITH